MKIIGISPLDKDVTVSFVDNGRVLFACGEERLSRVKLQDGFPHRAIAAGLEFTGWSASDVDKVAYGFFTHDQEMRLIDKSLDRHARLHGATDTARSLSLVRAAAARAHDSRTRGAIPGLPAGEEFMAPKSLPKRLIYGAVGRWARLDWFAHRRGMDTWRRDADTEHALRQRQIDEGLARYGWQDRLVRFPHHDTHAANAFYGSGFDSALVVTFDGYGSGQAGGVYLGDAEGVRALARFPFPNSLGQFYEHVTSGLGFKPGRHEGKIVGLAAYGDPDLLGPALRARFDIRDGSPEMLAAGNLLFTRALALRFSKRDIAAAYQSVLEQVACEVVAHWLRQTGQTRIVVSGGVHANVKLNQRLHELDGVQALFVYPNMGDGGCGTGAAWLVEPPPAGSGPIDTVYWGPGYDDARIRAALDEAGLDYDQPDDIEDRIAEALDENRIVGRFNGRMEYGPRALGNRSILYAPRDPSVNQWLNQQLGRTEFMPFAPAALASEADTLFENLAGIGKTAEFMTVTVNCTERMKRLCPAAVHVDGTARPQLVTADSNPSFHRILTRFHERSGTPALINTSFNMHEEPIVCSPQDAVRAFLLGNIDYLAIGPFMVPHPKLAEITASRSGAAAQTAAQPAAATV